MTWKKYALRFPIRHLHFFLKTIEVLLFYNWRSKSSEVFSKNEEVIWNLPIFTQLLWQKCFSLNSKVITLYKLILKFWSANHISFKVIYWKEEHCLVCFLLFYNIYNFCIETRKDKYEAIYKNFHSIR